MLKPYDQLTEAQKKSARELCSDDYMDYVYNTASPAPQNMCCPMCGHTLPQDQISLGPDNSERWQFCPFCGKPIAWKTLVPLEPQELHCKVCGCWLGTIEANGNSYASSHYNGTNICDSCMIEHCITTNCFGCQLGKYPDCQFLGQKTFYLEEERREREERKTAPC